MLHRHLTAAYRALDHKWGSPVDLDTSEDGLPCLPAVIEKPTTTFSSEEYLRKHRRPKPYSRKEEQIVKRKKMKDSFSNISLSRIPSASDLGGSVASLETSERPQSVNSVEELVTELKELVNQLKHPLEKSIDVSKSEVDLERRTEKIEVLFKKMKDTTYSFLKFKRK